MRTHLDGPGRQAETSRGLQQRKLEAPPTANQTIANHRPVLGLPLATRDDHHLVGLADHDVGLDEDHQGEDGEGPDPQIDPDELCLVHVASSASRVRR